MRFSEVVDSIESLKKFMDLNKIIPNEIIVVWDEPYEGEITKAKMKLWKE